MEGRIEHRHVYWAFLCIEYGFMFGCVIDGTAQVLEKWRAFGDNNAYNILFYFNWILSFFFFFFYMAFIEIDGF